MGINDQFYIHLLQMERVKRMMKGMEGEIKGKTEPYEKFEEWMDEVQEYIKRVMKGKESESEKRYVVKKESREKNQKNQEGVTKEERKEKKQENIKENKESKEKKEKRKNKWIQ